jgi:hypothetical protein
MLSAWPVGSCGWPGTLLLVANNVFGRTVFKIVMYTQIQCQLTGRHGLK